MKDNITITTVNVRGLTNYTKRIGILQEVKEKEINITCFKETYCRTKLSIRFSQDFIG